MRIGYTLKFPGRWPTIAANPPHWRAILTVAASAIILSWIDHWGASVGWGIRISMAVIGGALWLMGQRPAAESA